MEMNQEINPIQQNQWLVNYLKHQGDWLEKTRGNLMVAATVIPSMSFQVMVNPPGGVWENDDKCPLESGNVCKSEAGSSVLQYHLFKRDYYLAMVISSTLSFSASMSIILLIISGLRLRNRIIMGILVLFMVVAVLCMTAAFFLTIVLVHTMADEVIWIILKYYVGFWLLFPCSIILVQVIRLLVWFMRLVCCGRSQPSRSQHHPIIPTVQPLPDPDDSRD